MGQSADISNKKRISSVSISLILILLSLFCSFLFAELACRIISEFSVNVRYLATAGFSGTKPIAYSLEDYLHSFAPIVTPHREFYTYHANSLGLYDEEFVSQKSPETLRIAAIGDSFTYGSVPYPDTAMTQLEQLLKAQCKVELYNFGIPGAGIWDYKLLLPFVLERFNPDVVLLNFYMGNDGPDLLHERLDLPPKRRFASHSFVYALIRNLFRLKEMVIEPNKSSNSDNRTTDLNTAVPATYSDNTPPFNKPAMSESAYQVALRDELFRLYRAPSAKDSLAWQRLEQYLLELKSLTVSSKVKLLVTLYPSRLQIDTELRNKTIQSLEKELDRKGALAQQFLADWPEKQMLALCAKESLECFSLYPQFSVLPAVEQYFLQRDTHWSFAGNAFAAEQQAKMLAPLICSTR